jgi:hypothetical protein
METTKTHFELIPLEAIKKLVAQGSVTDRTIERPASEKKRRPGRAVKKVLLAKGT